MVLKTKTNTQLGRITKCATLRSCANYKLREATTFSSMKQKSRKKIKGNNAVLNKATGR